MNTAKESQSMKKQLADLLVAISWADLSRTYFGKSSSWLYQRINGNKVHGKPAKFTTQELEKLRHALREISQSIAGIVL